MCLDNSKFGEDEADAVLDPSKPAVVIDELCMNEEI